MPTTFFKMIITALFAVMLFGFAGMGYAVGESGYPGPIHTTQYYYPVTYDQHYTLSSSPDSSGLNVPVYYIYNSHTIPPQTLSAQYVNIIPPTYYSYTLLPQQHLCYDYNSRTYYYTTDSCPTAPQMHICYDYATRTYYYTNGVCASHPQQLRKCYDDRIGIYYYTYDNCTYYKYQTLCCDYNTGYYYYTSGTCMKSSFKFKCYDQHTGEYYYSESVCPPPPGWQICYSSDYKYYYYTTGSCSDPLKICYDSNTGNYYYKYGECTGTLLQPLTCRDYAPGYIPQYPISNPQYPQTYIISISNLAFNPQSLIVKAGSTVIWTNYDSVQHTITSDSGTELQSQLLFTGQTYVHTFNNPGTYYYHCTNHPYMTGVVIVI